MMKFATVAAVLALASTATPSLAQQGPQNQADLECAAVMLYALGNVEEDHEAYAGLAGGAMYFLGRLQGSSPTTNWLDRMTAYVSGVNEQQIIGNADRCANELQRVGDDISAWGEAIGQLERAQ